MTAPPSAPPDVEARVQYCAPIWRRNGEAAERILYPCLVPTTDQWGNWVRCQNQVGHDGSHHYRGEAHETYWD